jgi:hypothetical protein
LNVDTGTFAAITDEWLYMRGQVNGLTVRTSEMAERQLDLDLDNRALRYRIGEQHTRIMASLGRMEAKLDNEHRVVTGRPVLRVVEGGGRSGGRHHRPPRELVTREAARAGR